MKTHVLVAALIVLTHVTAVAQDMPDQKALSVAQKQVVNLVQARDAEGLAGMYASGALMRLRSGTVLNGAEEILAFWSERWDGITSPNPLMEWPTKVFFSEDLAFEHGQYGPKDSGPVGAYYRIWEWSVEAGWLIKVIDLE